MAKLIVVDDHPVVRIALRGLFGRMGLTVVGEASNGRDAIVLTKRLKPDLMILDLCLPDIDGTNVITSLIRNSVGTRFVVFTAHSEKIRILHAMKCGASAIVLKKDGVDDLCEVIKSVLSGHKIFPFNGLESGPVNAMLESNMLSSLTKNELFVLHGMVDGKGVSEIANFMRLSKSSIYNYRRNVLKKLNIEGKESLSKYAERLHR